jgi:hypothetical protein
VAVLVFVFSRAASAVRSSSPNCWGGDGCRAPRRRSVASRDVSDCRRRVDSDTNNKK